MKKKFDMEVTEKRAAYMKKLLIELYAHQIDAEIQNITIKPERKEEAVWTGESQQKGELTQGKCEKSVNEADKQDRGNYENIELNHSGRRKRYVRERQLENFRNYNTQVS